MSFTFLESRLSMYLADADKITGLNGTEPGTKFLLRKKGSDLAACTPSVAVITKWNLSPNAVSVGTKDFWMGVSFGSGQLDNPFLEVYEKSGNDYVRIATPGLATDAPPFHFQPGSTVYDSVNDKVTVLIRKVDNINGNSLHLLKIDPTTYASTLTQITGLTATQIANYRPRSQDRGGFVVDGGVPYLVASDITGLESWIVVNLNTNASVANPTMPVGGGSGGSSIWSVTPGDGKFLCHWVNVGPFTNFTNLVSYRYGTYSPNTNTFDNSLGSAPALNPTVEFGGTLVQFGPAEWIPSENAWIQLVTNNVSNQSRTWAWAFQEDGTLLDKIEITPGGLNGNRHGRMIRVGPKEVVGIIQTLIPVGNGFRDVPRQIGLRLDGGVLTVISNKTEYDNGYMPHGPQGATGPHTEKSITWNPTSNTLATFYSPQARFGGNGAAKCSVLDTTPGANFLKCMAYEDETSAFPGQVTPQGIAISTVLQPLPARYNMAAAYPALYIPPEDSGADTKSIIVLTSVYQWGPNDGLVPDKNTMISISPGEGNGRGYAVGQAEIFSTTAVTALTSGCAVSGPGKIITFSIDYGSQY